MEIQGNSSNTATGRRVTAASLEIGSSHATFDEVPAMKSRVFATPNQKTALVICTEFYSAKSIHAPFRQSVLSSVLSDSQTPPPSFTKQQTRPALQIWVLTFTPDFSALSLLYVVVQHCIFVGCRKFYDASGPQK